MCSYIRSIVARRPRRAPSSCISRRCGDQSSRSSLFVFWTALLHPNKTAPPCLPIEKLDDAGACPATPISGRFSSGGNTYHEPSSWRKNRIESGPDCEGASTRTQRHRARRDCAVRIRRIRAVSSDPNHFSMIHLSDCLSALILTLQLQVMPGSRSDPLPWKTVARHSGNAFGARHRAFRPRCIVNTTKDLSSYIRS